MKRAQIVTLAIAGLASIGAVVGIKGFVKAPPPQVTQAPVTNMTEVLVAKTDIGLGQQATEASFKWQAWPKDAVTPQFITKTAGANAMREFTGSIARTPIVMGEPITKKKLLKSGDGGVLAAILPAGMRAVSTKITEDTAVGRLILPNDHVDVILIRRLRSKAGQEDFVSDTLFRNVRVLAIGQALEAKGDKKNSDGNTATLELSPRQSELLALAKSMGEISLALRSIADISTDGPADGNDLKAQRGNAIKVLRYGVKSRAYGVN